MKEGCFFQPGKKKNPKYWIDSPLCEGICVGRSNGESRTDALSPRRDDELLIPDPLRGGWAWWNM